MYSTIKRFDDELFFKRKRDALTDVINQSWEPQLK